MLGRRVWAIPEGYIPGPDRVTAEPRRTKHLRFDDLNDPERAPRDTPHSTVIRSDAPIVVQRTRLDSRDPHVALLSIMAFAVES
jgi:hypothetical protein